MARYTNRAYARLSVRRSSVVAALLALAGIGAPVQALAECGEIPSTYCACAAPCACTVAGTHQITDGCDMDFGDRDVTIAGVFDSAVSSAHCSTSGTVCVQSSDCPAGQTCDGGSYSITARSLSVTGTVRANPRGSIDLELTTSLSVTGAITAPGGGDIEVCAGDVVADQAGSVVVSGAGLIRADPIPTGGSAFNGGDGTVNLDTNGGSISITSQPGDGAPAISVGRCDQGSCGTVSFAGQTVTIGSTAVVNAGASAVNTVVTDGGDISIDTSAVTLSFGTTTITTIRRAGGPVTVSGTVRAVGNHTASSADEATGGCIDISTEGDLNISDLASATLLANGNDNNGSGGDISLFAGGANVIIGAHADLEASGGGSGTDATDGEIDVDGCGVTLNGSMKANNTGDGTIDITYRNTLALTGSKLKAGSQGTVSVTCRDTPPLTGACDNPAPNTQLNATTPNATVTVSTDLGPCTGCGNGVLDTTPGCVPGAPGCEVCDDGNTKNCDGCTACRTVSPSCDDNNICTTDSCSPASGCSNVPVNCDDGNACTLDPACNPIFGCQHPPRNCDDGSVCTIDSCNPATGCVNAPITCSDGNVCTSDSCNAVTGCVFTPISCDDGIACTTDQCIAPSTGCVHTPVNSLCDDNSTCTDDVCTVTSGCVYSAHVFFCGNGVKEDPTACGSCGSPAEQCDGGDLGGATCPTPTYHGGTPICRADCTLDFDTTVGTQGGCWRCGNGRIEPGETCDGGNLNGTPGYGCPTNCATLCGDHVVQSNEQCDDGNRTDGDGCSSQCKLEYQYEGGGGEAKDCNLEWGVLGATPGATVTCADGSMACDQDGTINSSCRFAVSYCFNVYPGRPGAPACMPSNLATYQLWGASLSGSAMLDAATQTAVLDKLRSTLVLVLGTTVTASGPVRTVSPALLDLNLCGSLMLDVPLGQSRALAVQTNDSANVVDQDVMTFSCTQ